MTAPRFRSTAALATRGRREVEPVDWATFLVCTWRGLHLAIPVESTERVLRGSGRPDARSPSVLYEGCEVPVFALADALVCPAAHAQAVGAARVAPASHPIGTDQGRWVIVTVDGTRLACLVDAVREVASVDAARVRAVATDDPRQTREMAVRGAFVRNDTEVLVLDMWRVVKEAYAAKPPTDV